MKHEKTTLPYDYDALEPAIDETTMRTHHTKHHQGYTDNLNAALDDHDGHRHDILRQRPETLLLRLNEVPEDIQDAVRKNGGGLVNHNVFFNHLSPNDTEPSGELADQLSLRFGGVDDFKDTLKDAATSQFGSGWAWLVVDHEDELDVTTTPNQDSPYLHGKTPILGIDVWEHAYYLSYKNERGRYVDAVLDIVDWEQVQANYDEAL